MGARTTVTLAILGALALAQPAEAKRKRPSCFVDGTYTVRQSAHVRVYGEIVDEGNDVVAERLTGCWRATGRRTALASAVSSSGEDHSYRFVRLSGRRVRVNTTADHGEACKYGCAPGTTLSETWTSVFDVRRGVKLSRRLLTSSVAGVPF